MKRFLLPVVACLLLSPALSDAGDYPRDDIQVYGVLEHIATAEMNPTTKTQRGRDWGYAKGFGIEATLEDDYPELWRPRFEVTTGDVSHEEAAFAKVVSSSASFERFRLGIDHLYRLPLNDRVAIEPFWGGEGQFFHRRVSAGSNGDAEFARYDDFRYGVSARAGARIALNELKGVPYDEVSAARPARTFHAEIGVTLPLYYENRRKTSTGHQTSQSGRSPALFVEAGGKIGKFRPAVFYEGIRFGYPDGFLGQPQTSTDVFGVRLGYAF